MAGMDEHEPQMPRDPDEDDLPPEIERAEGPFTLTGWDRETGERIEGPIERIERQYARAGEFPMPPPLRLTHLIRTP